MRKKSSKPKNEAKTSYMFPSLHQDVSEAVSSDIPRTWFNKQNGGAHHEYSTHVMGTFKCDNGGCSNHGWGSKKVAILIRGFSGNGYNAVVFNQRCRSCNKLGTMTLDETSYIERVAYRVKKWAGVTLEEQPHDGRTGPPHKTELCEGCQSVSGGRSEADHIATPAPVIPMSRQMPSQNISQPPRSDPLFRADLVQHTQCADSGNCGTRLPKRNLLIARTKAISEPEPTSW
ncbi:zinc-binding domain-containing protein [Hypoxylon cercidicola]|nr:zinc-binding domain-containing protein [Hypoxylon cercidicola]